MKKKKIQLHRFENYDLKCPSCVILSKLRNSVIMVRFGPEGSKSNTINQYLLNVYKTKYDNDLELQVDILLFPEDGLSGFEFPKAHLAQPFLQTVRR